MNDNTGTVDAIQAGLRYVVVLITAIVALFGLVKAHDIAGLVNYVQTNGGTLVAAISGLVSLGTLLFGLFKTHKRGVQASQ